MKTLHPWLVTHTHRAGEDSNIIFCEGMPDAIDLAISTNDGTYEPYRSDETIIIETLPQFITKFLDHDGMTKHLNEMFPEGQPGRGYTIIPLATSEQRQAYRDQLDENDLEILSWNDLRD